jgi:hypothetical protein
MGATYPPVRSTSNEKLTVGYPDRRNNRKHLLHTTHSTSNMNRCVPYQLQQMILTASCFKLFLNFELSALPVRHSVNGEGGSFEPYCLSAAPKLV